MSNSKEKKKEEEQITEKIFDSAQEIEEYEQGYDLEALNCRYEFKDQATLSNGKVIRIVRGNEEEILCEGKKIFSGKIKYTFLLKDKLILTSGGKDNLNYLVIDFLPFISFGKFPQVRELVRCEPETNIKMERNSGKLWWNTNTSLVREGQTMLTVPLHGNSCIFFFMVEADYLTVGTNFDPPLSREDGRTLDQRSPSITGSLELASWNSIPALTTTLAFAFDR